jgi:hypothetical protein
MARKPKQKIAIKDMKWTSTKYENLQERSDKKSYRIRLTKIKTGSDGKPLTVTSKTYIRGISGRIFYDLDACGLRR